MLLCNCFGFSIMIFFLIVHLKTNNIFYECTTYCIFIHESTYSLCTRTKKLVQIPYRFLINLLSEGISESVHFSLSQWTTDVLLGNHTVQKKRRPSSMARPSDPWSILSLHHERKWFFHGINADFHISFIFQDSFWEIKGTLTPLVRISVREKIRPATFHPLFSLLSFSC